ncbi:MAG: hypothetical protein GY952_19030, partial [Rhodobacteraceae bacterium]|nr:hypothetical protein [Paracoccaceae bacterium]
EQLQSFAALGRLLPLKTDGRRPEAASKEYLSALDNLGYRFRMRTLDDRIEVNERPMSDPLRAEIRTRMRDLGYRNMGSVEDAYTAFSYRHAYNPIKDYLCGLAWDRHGHISNLACYFQDDHAAVYRVVTGEEGYTDTPSTHRPGSGEPSLRTSMIFYLWLRRWLVGAVGKALDARQGQMLVIDAKQGLGKSFLVRWLGSVLPDYFCEAPLNPDDKDTWLRLMSTFLWELGEVGRITKRSDRDALKHLITVRKVTVRKPYG